MVIWYYCIRTQIFGFFERLSQKNVSHEKKDTHLSASVSQNTLKNFEEFIVGCIYCLLSVLSSIVNKTHDTSPERRLS